tara:strand:- start:289 stop:480 length:192 start_codon:yes stop_codon:yes gene_type:complete
MASDYYYTTGPNAGQAKPGTRPETNTIDEVHEIPEFALPLPDDFDSVPYEYDPASGAWVKLIN